MPIESKIIAITGASAGLGKALSLEAGRRGHHVALISRSVEKLTELAETIRKQGGSAEVFPADIQSEQSVVSAFNKIKNRFGALDIVINCAGVVEPVAPLVKNSGDEMKSSLLTNVFGAYMLTREALKMMDMQENGGKVIHISSGAAESPYQGWSAYCSQKAALNMFIRTAAIEIQDRPVIIFGISPGPFESHMQEVLRQSDIEDFPGRDKFRKLYREKKLGQPDKIAKVILEISLKSWPELSGRIEDLRDSNFQWVCGKHGITYSNADLS